MLQVYQPRKISWALKLGSVAKQHLQFLQVTWLIVCFDVPCCILCDTNFNKAIFINNTHLNFCFVHSLVPSVVIPLMGTF